MIPAIPAITAFTLFAVSGCTTAPTRPSEPMAGAAPIDDPLDVAPDDFSIDLTISTARDDPNLPKETRSSRFVLFADGSLHWGNQENRGSNWLPPLRRTLDRSHMAQLWSRARSYGLSDSSVAEAPVNYSLLEPEPGEIIYILAMTGDDQRWGFVQRFEERNEPPDAAIAEIAGRLAGLAWTGEMPQDRPLIIPQRYDFGPDPYARYREP